VILFAKDAEAHRRLSMMFERREMKKSYLALVDGRVAEGGTIETPLREFGSGRTGVDIHGKPSLTRYAVTEALASSTLLDVEPLTGRRHQIRAHLYSIGHPIWGDPLYGGTRPVAGAPRLMLHARRLAFSWDGRPVAIEAEPPADFRRVLESAR
jgi:tRNA pseudouridine32 synthase / 23S rRNA pseudouridine746 synthase